MTLHDSASGIPDSPHCIRRMNHETHEYDVLVVGAGGAGLRAAIEASAAGVKVGLICKSLLGKAHTVMAEGGIAAALANVDDRDSWKVHFADTMRGGQYVNNWRMAELHAKEAPDRVRELEAWGAVFDRTNGRPHPAAQLRRPSLSAAGARRRSHRSRDDPHAAGSRHPSRHRRPHGVHRRRRCSRTAGGSPGVFGYERERGRFKAVSCRRPSCSRPAASAAPTQITSNSWEGTGDGHSLAYHAGAELIDMEFIQFHPTGMIWPPSVQGILVTEGVRGEGGILLNSEGRRFMFDDIPEPYRNQTADNEDEGWRYTQGDKAARRPPELLTRDHVARCINREVREGRGSPHGGVFLDIAWIKKRMQNAEDHIRRKLPSMYHQFKQLADIDITKEPMEVGPTTHYIMGGVQRGRRHADVERARAVCRRRVRGRHQRRESARRQLAVGPARVRQARRRIRGAVRESRTPRPSIDPATGGARRRSDALAPFETGRAENPYTIQHELQDVRCRGSSASSARKTRCANALGEHRTALRARAARRRHRPPRVQPGLAHGARPAQPADGVGGDRALRDRAQGEPRRALPRGLSREGGRVRHGQHGRAARPATGRWSCGGCRFREMPPELKQVIEENK